MRNVLNGTLKLAVKQNMILINPMSQIEIKSKPKTQKAIAYTTEEEIKSAKMELIRLSGNKEERALFEKRRQSLLDEVSALSYAEEKGIAF